MCDQDHVTKNCQKCAVGICNRSTTIIDFPLSTLRNVNGVNYYCIITDPRCDMYYDESKGKTERNTINGVQTNISTPPQQQQPKKQMVKPEPSNNKVSTQTKQINTNNTNKAGNISNTKNTNVQTNNQVNTKSNTGVTTGTTVNTNVNNSLAKTNGNAVANSVVAGNIVASDTTNNNIKAADTTDSAKLVDGSEMTVNANTDRSANNISNNVVNPTNNANLIDGSNSKNQIGGSGVSPYVIGSLSFFSVLLIVVGFLYIKKRKNDKESEIDPIYRNSSVFFATPILEKRDSQTSQKSHRSNVSKYSTHNRTVISSADDGDFDIVITQNNVNSGVNDTEQAATNTFGHDYAKANALEENSTSEFIQNSVSGINVSTTENFISQSNFNGMNTTSIISPSILSPTMPGDVSEDIISPVVPASVNQNITVQNASFSYDINDVSTHDPSISFINSTNGISFIKSKDESYMLSPIMDKSVSNIFTADMATENSINIDVKQLTSTPNLTNPTGKKTLSMVISEYKEDVIYAAKYNYEPSMEDEMKIRINDRVLVKEIFNDGWAYGENKTSEALGIFPINRLDSSS